ncbi:hypothetical protein BD779DRAFT_1559040 [Infundibulicybe gibba]|nr:hypothetical protein BD779DRAFT_1559040 [Infundibulicybe gibba]
MLDYAHDQSSDPTCRESKEQDSRTGRISQPVATHSPATDTRNRPNTAAKAWRKARSIHLLFCIIACTRTRKSPAKIDEPAVPGERR